MSDYDTLCPTHDYEPCDYDSGLAQAVAAEEYDHQTPTMDFSELQKALGRCHVETGDPSDEQSEYMRQADLIAILLWDSGDRGMTTAQLAPITPRYGARIETLRRVGFVIDAERIEQRLWRYVLRGVIPDYEPPTRNLRVEIPGRYVDAMRRAGLVTRQARLEFVLRCLDSYLP